MTGPDVLTLARLPALFAVAGLLGVPGPAGALAAWIVYLLGAVSDFFDGWWARRSGQTSAFGALMDALVDKVFVLGLLTTLLAYGALPLWTLGLVLLIGTREWLVTGLRQVAASKGIVVAAEKLGKWKTAAQMVSLGALFAAEWTRRLGAPGWTEGFQLLGIVLLVVATLLTLASGWGYWKQRRLYFGEAKA